MRPKLEITPELARSIVTDAGYIPEESYPGGNKKRWTLRCATCGTIKQRTLQSIRDGRECSGCRAQECVTELRGYGYTPLADFPGVDASWPMRHDVCGTEGSRSLTALRRGKGGCSCAHVATTEQAKAEVTRAGYSPMNDYPGRTDRDWLLRCNDCGLVAPRTLKSIRDKRACWGCRFMTADQAVAVLAEHGYTPMEDYPGNKNASWKVRCDSCGWEKPRSLKRIMQHRCRSCMGWLVRPEEIEERIRDAGFVPSVPYPGRKDRPWLCTCTGCSTEFPINIGNVCRGHDCGYCSGHYTDVAEAEATMIAKGFKPRIPYPGNAHTGWESDCLECGKIVYPHLANVRYREKNGCRYCLRKAVDPVDAEAFMHFKGWDPLVPYPATPREAWKCRCSECRRISEPSYKSVQRGHGCRFCNKQGFDYAGPGHVYVMSNTGLGAVKIGIFGKRARRSRSSIMRPSGWETFKVLACVSGEEARLIEQAVLHHLRVERGLSPYLTNDLMPQNGATETFDAEQISVGELWELVEAEAVVRDEEAGVEP